MFLMCKVCLLDCVHEMSIKHNMSCAIFVSKASKVCAMNIVSVILIKSGQWSET